MKFLEPVKDKFSGHLKIPHTCPCCTKCWLYIEGPRKGQCDYGGPYFGYIEMEGYNDDKREDNC